MSSSPSSVSSNDDAYFSAAEYVSPYKKGGGDESMGDSATCPLSVSLNALNDTAHEAVEFVNRCASIDPPKDKDNDDDHGDGEVDKTNPWNNMEAIAEKLENARSKIDQAWRDAKVVHEKQRERNGDEDENDNDETDDDDIGDDTALSTIDFTVPVNLDMEVTIDAGVNINEDLEIDSTSDEQQQEKKSDAGAIPADDFRALYMEMMAETFADDLEEIRQQGENVDVDVLVECLQSGINFLEPHEKHKKAFFDSLGYDGNGNGDETMKSNKEEGRTIHELRQHRLGYIGSD